ncbi:DUF4253 domain-containing protein [Streptomyces sp. NPDC005009]
MAGPHRHRRGRRPAGHRKTPGRHRPVRPDLARTRTAATPVKDADATADQYAQAFLAQYPHARLGLVAAPRGADALTTAGWNGPLNYDNDTATFSAVLRDWEDRFGARVVGVGFDTLHLSVAAPPHRLEDALRIAAEHFAFCPDNIWQGTHRDLTTYAEDLIDLNCWDFWWD